MVTFQLHRLVETHLHELLKVLVFEPTRTIRRTLQLNIDIVKVLHHLTMDPRLTLLLRVTIHTIIRVLMVLHRLLANL